MISARFYSEIKQIGHSFFTHFYQNPPFFVIALTKFKLNSHFSS
ncbi:hypothetical protein MHH_c06300 [Mannheimia haemolytica M42548]|nr:hypothetical protein MHH_c06300 [Mannheimia haemolytica M42548]